MQASHRCGCCESNSSRISSTILSPGVASIAYPSMRCFTPLALCLDDLRQIPSVLILPKCGSSTLEISRRDPLVAPCNLLETSDLVALPFFDGFDVLRCAQQAVEGSRIEPGKTAPQELHRQLLPIQVGLVDGGDLQLTAF